MDGTSSWLWKRLHEQFDSMILDLLFTVMISGYCHLLWICDLKTPIQKPGKTDEPNNLRPITLISELAKICAGTLSDCCEQQTIQDKQQGGWTAQTIQVRRAWMFWTVLVYRQHMLCIATFVAFVDLAQFSDTILVENVFVQLRIPVQALMS